MSEYILEMEGIHKSFPGVHALRGVELSVRPGTVHGVMGENGAGQVHAHEDRHRAVPPGRGHHPPARARR